MFKGPETREEAEAVKAAQTNQRRIQPGDKEYDPFSLLAEGIAAGTPNARLGKPGPSLLISFRDGAYKKISPPYTWKHSQWLHFRKPDGRELHVNPANVNYMEDVVGG